MAPTLGIVILAAGLGTRMKSDMAKVLHPICGRPMIAHVVQTAVSIAGPNVVVVVGHQAEKVMQAAGYSGNLRFAFQERQLGTGHAVRCALPHIPVRVRQVVVLCGDVPLIRPATIETLVADHSANGRDVTILAVSVKDPKGYGRLIFNDAGELVAIVEEADADEAQKNIKTINSGIYVVNRTFLENALPQIEANNRQKEVYLTDIIGIGYREHRRIGAILGRDSSEIIGVNSPEELQLAETFMRTRLREKS